MPKPAKTPLPFEVWALVAGGFAVALGYGVVAPTIPQFALEFGVSNFAASAIVSAFALMRLISAPFAGWLVAKLGERRTYTVGILIVALSTGAAALAANYPQFVALRGAGGIGSTLFTVASTALLAKVSPPDSRGRVASLNAAGFLLGGLFGPVLGGVVAVFGLRAPFVFYFITLVIAALVVALSLRNSGAAGSPNAPNTQRALGNGNVGDAGSLGFRQALRVSQYRTLLVSVFAFGWSSFGVRVSLVPLLVAVAFSGDATSAAWVLAAYAAGNAVLIFPSGRWNDSIGRKPLLIAGMAILAVSYASVGIASSLPVLAALMFIAGAGSALANPGQQAVLADVLQQRRGGNVVAGYSMASDLGGVLGPAVAGAIADAAGFGWAFALTAALLAVSATLWCFTSDSRQLSPPDRQPLASN